MFNKIGVELEFETHNGYIEDYEEDLFIELESHNLDINEVKGDGSLSSGGVEITTIPLYVRGEKDLKKQITHMELIRDIILNQYDGYLESPCAVHIHTSGHDKPTNLMYLIGGLYGPFNYIKDTNNWGYMHYPNTLRSLEYARDLLYNRTGSKKLVNNGHNYSNIITNCLISFAEHRPTTLRPSPYGTLELRPLANRPLKDIYRLYIEFITSFSILGDNMTLKDGEKVGDLFNNLHVRDLFKIIKGVCCWNNKELRDFMYKRNRNRVIDPKTFNEYLDGRIGTSRLTKKVLFKGTMDILESYLNKRQLKRVE